MLLITDISINDLAKDSGWPMLLAAYADESSIDEMPVYCPDLVTYSNLEFAGVFKIFAAYSTSETCPSLALEDKATFDDKLIGFISCLASQNPHYSCKIGTIESFFVDKAYRHTGAGLILLNEAIRHFKETDCKGLFISAPIEGQLASVLSKIKSFNQTNQVYFKAL